MKACRDIVILLFFAFFCPAAARAQNVPASVEPSRVPQQIAPMTLPAAPAGGAIVSGPGKVMAPEGADKIHLTLKHLVIEGMTVYKPGDIEPLYKKLLNHDVTLADIFGVAAVLTAKYRNDGYILTQAILPPQTIDDGTVHIRVVEGYIDRVMIQGKAGDNLSRIEGMAAKIRDTRPLTEKALERYMLLINDLPGVTARAVLSPAQVPGASDVTVIVGRKPVDLFLETDNRGSRYIGPWQLNAGATLNDALGHDESLSFQAATAPDGWPRRDMTFAQFGWLQPVGLEGTRISVTGSISSTHPGFTLSPFEVEGIAREASVAILQPFIRSRSFSVTGSAKFDYLDSFRSDDLPLPATVDRTRALRVGATVQSADRFQGSNILTAEASQGLNILDASRPGEANLTRAQGDAQFFKVTAQASRLQPVSGPFSVYASASGQKSADRLLASEQFGLGGPAFGSAYDSSEITGDDGIAGRLELRADNAFHTPLSLLELYGFYDIGQVWDPSNSVPAERIASLASAGVGFRAGVTANISASAEAAKPLTRTVETEGNKNMRFFGSLTFRY